MSASTVSTIAADTRVVYDTPTVMYELPIHELSVTIGAGHGIRLPVTDLLSNGRANYVLFQHLVSVCAGMRSGSEGGDSDLIDRAGRSVEVKAFTDIHAYPHDSSVNERIHTAASSTFGANNKGPAIKALLAAGDYNAAMSLCRATGYDKNDFYVYTNTRNYTADVPFRYIILPKSTVLTLLCRDDPRIITRTRLLGAITGTETIDAGALQLPGQ